MIHVTSCSCWAGTGIHTLDWSEADKVPACLIIHSYIKVQFVYVGLVGVCDHFEYRFFFVGKCTSNQLDRLL